MSSGITTYLLSTIYIAYLFHLDCCHEKSWRTSTFSPSTVVARLVIQNPFLLYGVLLVYCSGDMVLYTSSGNEMVDFDTGQELQLFNLQNILLYILCQSDSHLHFSTALLFSQVSEISAFTGETLCSQEKGGGLPGCHQGSPQNSKLLQVMLDIHVVSDLKQLRSPTSGILRDVDTAQHRLRAPRIIPECVSPGKIKWPTRPSRPPKKICRTHSSTSSRRRPK